MRWLTEHRLRKLCRRSLRSLGLRAPFRVEELCARLGEQRGRPLRLVPHPLPVPGPYGAWIATDSADYILYQRETTKLHQDHIVLHEIGHIIAGHHSESDEDLRWADETPDLSRETVNLILRRTSYDCRRELEAETIATIIMEQIVSDGFTALPGPDDVAAGIRSALGDRRGWL